MVIHLHLIVIFYFKAKSIQLLVAAISRSGTDVDAANLYQRFKALDFEVHLFNNQTCQQMMLIMREGESRLPASRHSLSLLSGPVLT